MRILVGVLIFSVVPVMVWAGSGTHAEGDYLGQTPPGGEAVMFAPGLVSVDGRYEYGVAFSPAGDEMFFTAEYPREAEIPGMAGLLVMRRDGDKWEAPVVANLRGDGSWEQEAFYTIDGTKLYFCSEVAEMEYKLWVTERGSNGWGPPVLLDSPVNTSADIVFYATFTGDGTMYYTNVDERKIYFSRFVDGGYPETRPAAVPFGGHAFVSPEGDFLLLDYKGDIWVTFAGLEGVWTEPVKLGSGINTESTETCPSLSPDGKYIFFARYNEPGDVSNIYWVRNTINRQGGKR